MKIGWPHNLLSLCKNAQKYMFAAVEAVSTSKSYFQQFYYTMPIKTWRLIENAPGFKTCSKQGSTIGTKCSHLRNPASKIAIFESAMPNFWSQHSSACSWHTKSFSLPVFFCELSPRGIHAASDARQFFCTLSFAKLMHSSVCSGVFSNVMVLIGNYTVCYHPIRKGFLGPPKNIMCSHSQTYLSVLSSYASWSQLTYKLQNDHEPRASPKCAGSISQTGFFWRVQPI